MYAARIGEVRLNLTGHMPGILGISFPEHAQKGFYSIRLVRLV